MNLKQQSDEADILIQTQKAAKEMFVCSMKKKWVILNQFLSVPGEADVSTSMAARDQYFTAATSY